VLFLAKLAVLGGCGDKARFPSQRNATTPSPHWCTRLSPAASTTMSVYCWCTEEDDRQAATRPQRSYTSRIEPRQVR